MSQNEALTKNKPAIESVLNPLSGPRPRLLEGRALRVPH